MSLSAINNQKNKTIIYFIPLILNNGLNMSIAVVARPKASLSFALKKKPVQNVLFFVKLFYITIFYFALYKQICHLQPPPPPTFKKAEFS